MTSTCEEVLPDRGRSPPHHRYPMRTISRKKAWKTALGALTMAKGDPNGECRLTGWAMKQIIRRALAAGISRLPPGLLTDKRFFELYQSRGIHILPTDFYSPVPDTREINVVDGERITALRGINTNIDAQRALAMEPTFRAHRVECLAMIERYSAEGRIPVSFGGMDAAMLYHFVRKLQPRRIIEIGCGFSTMVISEALEANAVAPGDCDFTSIDPYPRDFLLEGASRAKMRCDKLQAVPLGEFEALSVGDILFIDSSHVVKAGSDVLYEINEILPALAVGVHIHFHDIHFPFDYTRDWIMNRHTFWNEQYALQAFLQFNAHFEILWSVAMMRAEHPELLADLIPDFDQRKQQGGSFWMRRVVA